MEKKNSLFSCIYVLCKKIRGSYLAGMYSNIIQIGLIVKEGLIPEVLLLSLQIDSGWRKRMRCALPINCSSYRSPNFLADVSIKEMKTNVAMGENKCN